MKLGATFSHPHLKSLNLDPLKATKEFKNLNLPWIRLGCYWNEIEKTPGKYSFRKIEPLIEFCEKKNINVVLTVGMKAPRDPEYYIPDWLLKEIKIGNNTVIKSENKILLEPTLKFLEKTIDHFKGYSNIKIWQVENEPFDPFGLNSSKISGSFLKEEVSLVKKLDPSREILTSVWGNNLSEYGNYKKAAKLAGIIAFDFYLRCPHQISAGKYKYLGPNDSKEEIAKIVKRIKSHGKKFWITELQAEPWEPEEILTKKKNPPSFLPKHFEENLNYAIDLDPEVTLLWGFEYWYWKKENGDLRYWKEAKRVINKYS